MSLIVDLLKRIKGVKGKRTVHPFFLKNLSKGRRTGIYLILALLLVLSGVGAYIGTQILLSGGPPPPKPPIVKKIPPPRPPIEQKQPIKPAPVQEVKKEKPPEIEEKKAQKQETAPPEPEKKEPSPPKRAVNPGQASPTAGVEKLVPEKKEVKVEAKTPAPPKPKPKPKVSQKELTRLLVLADRYFREGKLYKSAELYERVLKLKKDKRVANNLVVVYSRLGMIEKAKGILEKFPDEDVAFTYLLEISRLLPADRVLEEAENLLNLDVKGKILLAIGYIREKQRDFEGALESYGEAFEKNPADPYIAFNYARLLESMGRLKRAVAIYRSLANGANDKRIERLAKERVEYYRRLGLVE